MLGIPVVAVICGGCGDGGGGVGGGENGGGKW